MARTSGRRDAGWLTVVDIAAGILLAMTAVPLLAIAASGRAGGFGGAFLLPALTGLLALPLVAFSCVARARWRSPGPTGRWVLLGALAVAASVALIPGGDALRQRLNGRDLADASDALVADAQHCAKASVSRVADEVESNPGVEVRPRLTAAAIRCMEQRPLGKQSTCFYRTCSLTMDHADADGNDTVVVDLRTFLEQALREAGRGPYDRQPQPQTPPRDPDGVWLE